MFTIFFVFTLAITSYAFADVTSSEMFAEPQLALRLRDGHIVQIYIPELNSPLQNWVDSQTKFLLSSEIGLALCQQVLNANITNLQDFLGVSELAAVQIAHSCQSNATPHPFVDNFKISGPIKMIKSPAFERRHYQFVFTSNDQWPFDSWTDAATNQTTVLVQGEQQQDKALLSKSMAHEFAIYFDGQYSVGTNEWWDIHANEKFKILTVNQQRLFSAVNNPLIAAILAYMRAFRVEQQIFHELSTQQTNFKSDYLGPAFGFLDEKCDHNCLMNFVKAQSLALSPYALALTAYSGPYKNSKAEELIRNNPSKGHLFRLATLTFNAQISMYSNYSKLPFIALVESLETWIPRQLVKPVQNLFNNHILPEDLEYLDRARIEFQDSGETISFLQWILRPVLSGRNVDFSSGPRPRIRTGGGGYAN